MDIISKFKEKPKTSIAWRAMWLGLCTIFVFPALGIFGAFISPMISQFGSEKISVEIGFIVAILLFVLSIFAIFSSVSALRKGERSWVLWIGFVPAVLVGCFWIFMIVGEFLFPH